MEVPDKTTWQKNRRYMAWFALLIMGVVTV